MRKIVLASGEPFGMSRKAVQQQIAVMRAVGSMQQLSSISVGVITPTTFISDRMHKSGRRATSGGGSRGGLGCFDMATQGLLNPTPPLQNLDLPRHSTGRAKSTRAES